MRRSTLSPSGRHGVAALWVVIVLALLGALIGTITSQHLAGRRVLRARQHRVQAGWLARSGIELAAAHLLADKQPYRGETVELIDNSKVIVVVGFDPAQPDIFSVACTASYPINRGPNVVTQTQERVFRRVRENDKARLEVVRAP